MQVLGHRISSSETNVRVFLRRRKHRQRLEALRPCRLCKDLLQLEGPAPHVINVISRIWGTEDSIVPSSMKASAFDGCSVVTSLYKIYKLISDSNRNLGFTFASSSAVVSLLLWACFDLTRANPSLQTSVPPRQPCSSRCSRQRLGIACHQFTVFASRGRFGKFC